MTPRISCYDCRYFSATHNGRAGYNPNPPLYAFRQGNSGFCHRFTPQHGRVLQQPNGDTVVGLGEWPKVFTHDWCGEFVPRVSHVHDNKKPCTCAENSEGESYCEK